MKRAIVVRGRLSDPRHIELDEAITDVSGAVEIVLSAAGDSQRQAGPDVFEFIARLRAGSRTKQDIDEQIRVEREAWFER